MGKRRNLCSARKTHKLIGGSSCCTYKLWPSNLESFYRIAWLRLPWESAQRNRNFLGRFFSRSAHTKGLATQRKNACNLVICGEIWEAKTCDILSAARRMTNSDDKFANVSWFGLKDECWCEIGSKLGHRWLHSQASHILHICEGSDNVIQCLRSLNNRGEDRAERKKDLRDMLLLSIECTFFCEKIHPICVSHDFDTSEHC